MPHKISLIILENEPNYHCVERKMSINIRNKLFCAIKVLAKLAKAAKDYLSIIRVEWARIIELVDLVREQGNCLTDELL